MLRLVEYNLTIIESRISITNTVLGSGQDSIPHPECRIMNIAYSCTLFTYTYLGSRNVGSSVYRVVRNTPVGFPSRYTNVPTPE